MTVFLVILLWKIVWYPSIQPEEVSAEGSTLQDLPAPENPRWDGETGIGLWGNVPESGIDSENSVRISCVGEIRPNHLALRMMCGKRKMMI